MSEPRKKADWQIVAAVVVALLIPLAAYVVCYFAMSEHSRGHMDGPPMTFRKFDARWKAVIFWPAGIAEEFLIQERVIIDGPLPPPESP